MTRKLISSSPGKKILPSNPQPSPAAIMSKSSSYCNQWNSLWLLSHKRLDELQNPSGLRNRRIYPCQGSDPGHRTHSTAQYWMNSLPEFLPSGVEARSCHWVRDWVGPRASLTSVAERKTSNLACPRNTSRPYSEWKARSCTERSVHKVRISSGKGTRIDTNNQKWSNKADSISMSLYIATTWFHVHMRRFRQSLANSWRS